MLREELLVERPGAVVVAVGVVLLGALENDGVLKRRCRAPAEHKARKPAQNER